MSKPEPPPLAKVDPAQAWQPWQPDDKEPWGLQWAGHLFRRAAFGATPAQLRAAVDKGLPATLDELFKGDAQALAREPLLAGDGGRIAARNNPFDLRGWWLARMVYSGQPLREKMTLFWHNHFATSVIKVQSVALMHKQNELIRRHALGKFRPFLLDVSKDPAMLLWLDSNSNVTGKPNENYAREVMELFSLGVGHYTEKDIREAARAFTGWHTANNEFKFAEALHDAGQKTILRQTGAWDGGDVVRIVLDQPAAAEFLVRKLYRYFISETADPPDALLQPLADALRKSDYDIQLVVRTMLGSRHFFSAHAYRRRVKGPIEFVLGAVHALGLGLVSPRAVVKRLEAQGQELFAPPNVKGWQGGQSWLNTATMLARHNFAQALAMGMAELNLEDPDPSAGVALAVDIVTPIRRQMMTDPAKILAYYLDALLQSDLRPAARARLLAFLQEGSPQGDARDQRIREMVHAIMTTSEYQLA